MGVKGSLATTRPSKIVLNIERRAVNANPDSFTWLQKRWITRTHLWRTSISSSPLSSPCLCSSAFLHPVEENSEESRLHMYNKRNVVAKRIKYSQPPIFFSCSCRGWPTLREPPFSSPAFCSASQSQT